MMLVGYVANRVILEQIMLVGGIEMNVVIMQSEELDKNLAVL
jgi:hypothetical protein